MAWSIKQMMMGTRIVAWLGGAMLVLVSSASFAVQTCKSSSIAQTAPDSRYQNNNNGTVTDLNTNLMWQQCSVGLTTSSSACDTGTATTYSWKQALQYVESLNAGGGFTGYSDWRLPNSKELESMVEYSCYNPAINANFFPNTISGGYWTSSPSAAYGGGTWYIDFYYGDANDFYLRDANFYLRLVRDL